jgi:hypothetical protein
VFRSHQYGLALAATLIFGTACTEEKPIDPGPTSDAGIAVVDDGGTSVDGGVVPDGGIVTPAFPESAKATLRFKRNERLLNDIAQALGLAPSEVCNELGRYSCTDFVHTIALGGVEPYSLGLREGLANTTITAPNAVDRLVLSGCEVRVTRDFTNPGAAVLFKDLPVDPSGELGDLEAPGVSASIDRLYKGALQRVPTAEEIAHLKSFHTDLKGTAGGDVARDWALLSCFSVLSSMESLFY